MIDGWDSKAYLLSKLSKTMGTGPNYENGNLGHDAADL